MRKKKSTWRLKDSINRQTEIQKFASTGCKFSSLRERHMYGQIKKTEFKHGFAIVHKTFFCYHSKPDCCNQKTKKENFNGPVQLKFVKVDEVSERIHKYTVVYDR